MTELFLKITEEIKEKYFIAKNNNFEGFKIPFLSLSCVELLKTDINLPAELALEIKILVIDSIIKPKTPADLRVGSFRFYDIGETFHCG